MECWNALEALEQSSALGHGLGCSLCTGGSGHPGLDGIGMGLDGVSHGWGMQ